MSRKRKPSVTKKRVFSKCIYCQTELSKGKRSKEHVVNKSILPKYNDKLTLSKKVCRGYNNGFTEIDKAFVESTNIGFNKCIMDIINDEDRWDHTQEPFVIKNFSRTIRGDKQVFTVEANGKQQKNILRGIAKIALNALIYDLNGEKRKFGKDRQGNCHYGYVRNDDIFTGNEESLSEIKSFIKEGGKFPGLVVHKRIPLQIYDENMGVQGANIPLQNVTDPTHIIGIYKDQSRYYGVIGLFIGLDEQAPLYFVPLIGDIDEIDLDSPDPEEVRLYNFGNLIKKRTQQESIRPCIIDIVKGDSAYLIKPVSDPKWIHRIHMSKNNL